MSIKWNKRRGEPELERLTRKYLAKGGKITKLDGRKKIPGSVRLSPHMRISTRCESTREDPTARSKHYKAKY